MRATTTISVASRDELVGNPRIQRPHVVILGAGASVAACSDGDKNNRRLPTMEDFVEVLGLKSLLSKHGIKYRGENFEALYGSMWSSGSHSELIREIESTVYNYFLYLELPDSPTIYDHLLLSLRRKDAVFTFNWDPFLHDAWVRNHHFDLPEIFFLHGNVRAAYCDVHHQRWGASWLNCPECNAALTPSKLLYPVTQKNYSADPHIQSQWENARWFLKNAFALTIFGYGAPDSDLDAVEIMKTAWHERGERLVERVEIIDIKYRETLYKTWSPFVFHHHYDCRRTFYESWIANYPRRSCEALYAPTVEGRVVEERFPIPRDLGFSELYDWLAPIAKCDVEVH